MGIVDENQIEEMSFVFFEAILEALGQKLTYEAVSNYAGNSFCHDSWEMISEANPIHLMHEGPNIGKNSKNKGLFDFIEHNMKNQSKDARGPAKKGGGEKGIKGSG